LEIFLWNGRQIKNNIDKLGEEEHSLFALHSKTAKIMREVERGTLFLYESRVRGTHKIYLSVRPVEERS